LSSSESGVKRLTAPHYLLLCLPEECQGWTLPTLLRQMVWLPAVLVEHARVLLARVAVPATWLAWWEYCEER
jgi:hypothetical protein